MIGTRALVSQARVVGGDPRGLGVSQLGQQVIVAGRREGALRGVLGESLGRTAAVLHAIFLLRFARLPTAFRRLAMRRDPAVDLHLAPLVR
jgi:hypothetical protein